MKKITRDELLVESHLLYFKIMDLVDCVNQLKATYGDDAKKILRVVKGFISGGCSDADKHK